MSDDAPAARPPPATVNLGARQAHEHMRTAPKVVLCGEPTVGKTTLAYQMEQGVFQESQRATLGMEFHPITTAAGRRMQVWDLAGQMRASAANAANFRSARGVVVVASLTSTSSIEAIPGWLREVRGAWAKQYSTAVPPDTPEGRRTPMPVRTALVFNKTDLAPPSEETRRELEQLVTAYGCHACYFTTATKHDNVAAMFEAVAEDIEKHAPPPPPVATQRQPQQQAKSRCPCSGGGGGGDTKPAKVGQRKGSSK